MFSFLSFSLLLWLNPVLSSQSNECPTPSSCQNLLPEEKEVVQEYCLKQHGNLSESFRCCSSNDTIIGLDLRYCEITKLNITVPEFLDVECLDLRNNSFEKFTSNDLIGFLQLESLYLPKNIPCPGGKSGWVIDKQESNMTLCQHQLNLCDTLNITCGTYDNAHCVHSGPGLSKCQCAPNHFGYKCLNEGTFPVAIFTTGVVVPTIVLSIVFWFVHGRDPYKRRV